MLRSLTGVCRPDTDFIYIGDTLRCPYGDRSAEEIASFVDQLTAWLINQGADAIVMACNTSAARAKKQARRESPVPTFDLLTPTAWHIATSGMKKVGVLATASTAQSHAFARSINVLADDIEVIEVGCPLLVPVVEAGLSKSKEAVEALRVYVLELIEASVEAIIYGCTHYPFLEAALKKVLRKFAPYEIAIINPADLLAEGLGRQSVMTAASYENTLFVTTGDAETFTSIASQCLETKIHNVANLPLSKLLTVIEPLPTLTVESKPVAYPFIL